MVYSVIYILQYVVVYSVWCNIYSTVCAIWYKSSKVVIVYKSNKIEMLLRNDMQVQIKKV
jgi:hypothetical protein